MKWSVCPLKGCDSKKKYKKMCVPSVSGVLLWGVQRGTCVNRCVCREVHMYLDTARIDRDKSSHGSDRILSDNANDDLVNDTKNKTRKNSTKTDKYRSK